MSAFAAQGLSGSYENLYTWLCHFETAEDVPLFWKNVPRITEVFHRG